MTALEFPPSRCLVCDLGAGSGRVMLAELYSDRLVIRQVHRFSGYEVRLEDGPAWDIDLIRAGIREGLRLSAAFGPIASVAVDSWGVDFALLDADGMIVDQPRTYRHPRGAEAMTRMAGYQDWIGERTGVQMLPIATVFQLSQWALDHPGALARVRHFIMMADLFAFDLSGVIACEVTLSRTTGLLADDGKHWDRTVIGWAGVPADIFGRLVTAGTALGPLRTGLADHPHLSKTKVLAAAGHDTACAAFALAPRKGEAAVICGSWNLFCADVPAGFIPPKALSMGFGLEGGINGRALLVKSLPGLFLIRRLRDSWKARTGEDFEFMQLGAMALVANANTPPIDASDPLFFDPLDLVAAMIEHKPELEGASFGVLSRSLYRGLARGAAACIEQLGELSGLPISTIRVGGGGVQDDAWKQFLAAECGCQIVSGPIEASAVGNALIQFVALGSIPTYEKAQEIARGGFPMEFVEP